jgi:predicted phosphodiesterase
LNYIRQVGETEEEFILRVCADYDKIGTWDKIAMIINEELGWEYTESKYRKQYQKKYLESRLQHSDSKEDILYKERVKNNDKIREFRNGLRQEAREEHFYELIVEAANRLSPIKIPKLEIKPRQTNTSALQLIADEHFGVDFKINGLEFGEVLNEYSPEEFEKRMWKLLNDMVILAEKEHQQEISTFFLGDSLDGILRISQLMSLRYGIVDSCLLYAEFISNWLNELSKYLKVHYYSTYGNHTMLRLLDGKKNSFPNENMQKIIDKFVEIRTENNPNLTIHKNNTEKIFVNIQGFNVLGVHGEEKSAEQALKDYSNLYNKNISYLIFGHKHHPFWEGVGFTKGVIGSGSIMGTDDFAIRLRTGSNPCSTFCIFEQEQGKVQENIINL